MNIKEYIESGILELYVLGGLSAEEQSEVTMLLKKHPELQEELQRIEMDFMHVAEAMSPESLNQDILKNAMSRIDSADLTETKVVPIVPKAEGNVPSKSKGFLNLALIAASVALLFSLGLNFKFYNNLQDTRNQLTALQDQNSVFAEDLKVQTTKFEETQDQLYALSNANTLKIRLNGIEGKEESLATVFWNQETKETYLNVDNLPAPPEGMQYQLWALLDGVPVDAGVFDVNGKIQHTKNIEGAQAFAITLEEAGGKPSPNLEQLFVIGNV